MILTEANGRPFERPRRKAGESLVEFVRRYHAWKNEVTACANGSFEMVMRTRAKRESTDAP